MGLVKWSVLVAAIGIGIHLSGYLFPEPKAPTFQDGWWGDGEPPDDTDSTEQPLDAQTVVPLEEFKVIE